MDGSSAVEIVSGGVAGRWSDAHDVGACCQAGEVVDAIGVRRAGLEQRASIARIELHQNAWEPLIGAILHPIAVPVSEDGVADATPTDRHGCQRSGGNHLTAVLEGKLVGVNSRRLGGTDAASESDLHALARRDTRADAEHRLRRIAGIGRNRGCCRAADLRGDEAVVGKAGWQILRDHQRHCIGTGALIVHRHGVGHDAPGGCGAWSDRLVRVEKGAVGGNLDGFRAACGA